jgi:hypothetical protein
MVIIMLQALSSEESADTQALVAFAGVMANRDEILD